MNDQRGPHSITQLIGQATEGDAASIERLLLLIHDEILDFARVLVSAPQAALGVTPEDVLQETLVQAFQSIRQLNARDEAGLLGWLRTIARTRLTNLVHNRLAQKRGGTGRDGPANAMSLPVHGRQASLDDTAACVLRELVAAGPTPSAIIRRREASGAIAANLARLAPEKREILELRYGHGLEIREIAVRVGKGESAVKMSIERSLKDLRALLSEMGEFTRGM